VAVVVRMPKRKAPAKSSLEGWSEVIRHQGEESSEREKVRKKAAADLLEKLKSFEDLKLIMRTLFTSYEAGELNHQEFFEAAHRVLEMEPPG